MVHDTEKVQNLLENIIEVGFEGIPIPNYEKTDSLEELLKQYNIPGLGIVVIEDFEILWMRFFGVRSRNPKINSSHRVDIETLFEAASATKTVITVAALHLVDLGILELDVDVNAYLKDWKIPINVFTDEKKVTLRHLLSHMSGINRPESMYSYEEETSPTLINVLEGEFPATNDPVKVEFVPGSKHQYSNLGFDVIQKIIEDVTEKSLNQFLKEVIFDPLDMNSVKTTVEYPLPSYSASIAIDHHTPDGKTAGKGLHPSAYGHGNLSINPWQFSKFVVETMKSYQGKSNKILSQEITKRMLEAQYSFGPTELMGITDQALGFFLMKNGKNTFFMLPGSNAPGANCMLLGSPITGQGVVIMTNGAMGELLNIRLTYTLAKEYNWNFGILE